MFNGHIAEKRRATALRAHEYTQKEASIRKRYIAEVQPALLDHYKKRLKSFILKVATALVRCRNIPLSSILKICCPVSAKLLDSLSRIQRIGKVYYLSVNVGKNSSTKLSYSEGRLCLSWKRRKDSLRFISFGGGKKIRSCMGPCDIKRLRRTPIYSDLR